MLSKLIRLFLLFCLALLIVGVASLQTEYAQRKIADWLENKSDGALKIGKVEGIFPFWLRLTDVEYQSPELQVSLNRINLSLSPITLLKGHLSIFNLAIDHAQIHTEGHNWPEYPFPIFIHHFTIHALDLNEYKDLSVTGSAELNRDFAFQLTVKHPKFPDGFLHLNLEADAEKQTIALVSQLKQNTDFTFWLSGKYFWQQGEFEGSLTGKGLFFRYSSDITLSESSTLRLSSIKTTFLTYQIRGDLEYDLSTQKLLASGNFLERPFTLQTELHLSEASIQASSLLLTYADDQLSGSFTYKLKEPGFTGSLDLEINDLTPFPLESPLEGRALGHLTFTQESYQFSLQGEQLKWKDLYLPEVTMEGIWKNKQLSFDLNFQEFTVLDPSYEVFPHVHLQLTGFATKELLAFSGTLYGLGETPFSLKGEVPIHVQLRPLDVSIDQNSPFSLQMKGRGSIDPLLAFLENASLIARGYLDLELEAVGTWNEPELKGYLIYDQGRIESLTTGALFRDIHMEMQANGRELQICSLIAHDFDRGDLTGNGSIMWNPEEGFPFEFHLFASRYMILALDPFTASVNAEATMSGNIHEMFISGKAEVVKAHLAIPNKMPVQVPIIDVTYINPIATPKPEVDEEKRDIPIHWDITIEAPRYLTIDGRGLTSEWSGTMRITGEQNALHYMGQLALVQGRFSILNHTFDLVEGKVRIEGLEPKHIHVDLKGDYELVNLTTSILISGTLDNTHLSFCSSPPMSTNQILSWIIFNQDINELSPFQACRLASLLVTLSGSYSGPKTFSSIKEGLGIDVFSITDCDLDSADFTFQVGKYISQGTFVGINKSISGDFDSVIIQTRLYRDFFLEANYGGSLNGLTPNGGKVVFKWYKSY